MKMEINNNIGLLVMAMETTLAKHQKNKGDSWKWCNIEFLEDKLREEFNEWEKSKDKHELIDIANICMMLFNRELWKINNIVIEQH